MASIRGHQTAVKFLKNGQATEILNVTNFEVTQDSSFTRSYYVGQPLAEGDQAIEGWSGTVEAEVKDAKIDDLIDALVTQNLAGFGIDEVTIVDTENYPDGQIRSYVYFDVQMKMSKRQAGLQEKVTKRLEWQAAGRVQL